MAYCPLLKTYGGRERHRESLSIPLETLSLHIAISCLSLIWSNLELHSSEASRSSSCSPAAVPSLFLFSRPFSLSLPPHPPPQPYLCNVMISMLRTSKASPGHQSLRQSVSCLAVSQLADQSPSSHSCWITHSIARLIAQPLTHSVSHLFFLLYFSLFFLSLASLCHALCETYMHTEIDTLQGLVSVFFCFVFYRPPLRNWLQLILAISACLSNCWVLSRTETTSSDGDISAERQGGRHLFLQTFIVLACALYIWKEIHRRPARFYKMSSYFVSE